MEETPPTSMALSNTTELASIREERLARPQRRRNSIPDCDDGMLGLLATTERLRMEGVSVEAQQAERLRLDESRDQDLVVMEQDALLRMRQSVSSVFNAPDIPGDDTYSWLWESAEDTYEYWTATDVTPVTSVQMPEVDVSDFDGYLERMAPFRAFFAQNAVELDDYNRQEAANVSSGATDEERFVQEMLSDEVSPEQGIAQAEALGVCFEQLPRVFLQNPSTFDVAECGVFDVAFGSPAGAEEEMAQLKRCHKLVEGQLLSQISSKFSSFFVLLQDLELLEEDTRKGNQIVGGMRGALATLSGDTVEQASNIGAMMQQRRNLQELYRRLELVQALKESEQSLQAQLECNDFVGALKLSSESAAVLRDDLVGIRCLQNVTAKISGLSEQVHHKMSSDFVDIALNFSSQLGPQRELLATMLTGQAQVSSGALRSLRSGSVAQIKTAAQDAVESVNRDASLDDLSWIASIDHDDFVVVMERVTRAHLPRLQSLNELQLFATAVMEDDKNPLIQQFVDVVHAAIDESHKRCARILGARARQLVNQPLTEFHKVYVLTNNFACEGDKLGRGKQGFSLRAALMSHAKTFVDGFHQNKLEKIGALLEQELWDQSEVHPRWQAISDNLGNPGAAAELAAREETVGGASARTLLVDGKQYRVCSSLIMLLEMLSDYLHCVDKLPGLCTDIVQRVAALLKHYNSRTCQLVLGAGAMACAGLKSITVRNLVLASQCLSVALAKIPAVRTHLGSYMPERFEPLLVELDRIAKDYVEHRSEIYTKVVNILKDRIDHWCGTLKQQPAWFEDPEPHTFMKGIQTDAMKLFKVLMQYLPPEQLKLILEQIGTLLNSHLVSHLSTLNLSNQKLCKHLQGDIAWLISSLEALKGFNTQFAILREFSRDKLGAFDGAPKVPPGDK